MRRRDSDERFKAAAVVYAIAGVLFVALAAVTLTWWIAAFGVVSLLLAAWNIRRLRRLAPFPTDREGTPPDSFVGQR